MALDLEVLDIFWSEVQTPTPGTDTVQLPLGSRWLPNDWRFIVACGDMWKVFSYNSGFLGDPYYQPVWSPATPPAGWLAIGNETFNIGNFQDRGVRTIVLAHKLTPSSADGEFSLINPPDSYSGAGQIRWSPWFNPLEKPGLFGFTVRGIDPTFTPTASCPTVGFTEGPPTNFTLASRTLSNLPGFEILVPAILAGSAKMPAGGWTEVWNNDFCMSDFIAPSSIGTTLAILGKRYTSSPSGTTTLSCQEGVYNYNIQSDQSRKSPLGGQNPIPLAIPVIYVKQSQNVTIGVNPGTAETYTSNAVTPVFGTSVIVPVNPGPAETYTSGQTFSALTGYAVTDPYPLGGDPVESSVVRWTSVITPGRSGARVLASLDWGRTWTECVNGGPVPGLRHRDTVTDAVLFKVELWRDDVSVPKPKVYLDPQISCDAGRDEYVPLGTFLLKETDVDVNPDSVGNNEAGSGNGVVAFGGGQTGGGRAISIKATDLSLAIAEHKWEEPYWIKASTPYDQALHDMVVNRLPGQTAFDIAATLETCPLLLYGTVQNSDSWQDIRELAMAIGWECYFDPWGKFVARPVRDPALATPVWTFNQILGPPVVSIKRTLTRAEVYNHIIVEGSATSPGTGAAVVPARAEWKNLDPNHPTFIGGKFGIKPYKVQLPAVTSDPQAQVAADALGILLREGAETVEIVVPPVPFLENGDVVELDLADAKIDGNYVVQAAESPASAKRGQRLTLFRQSRAA